MDDVRLKILEGRPKPWPRAGEPKVGVPGQRNGGAPEHLDSAVRGGSGTWSDHQSGVSALLEMLDGPKYGVGHTVDLGEEGFADDGDSHDPTVPGSRPFPGTAPR